ncbi:MAG: PGPGW domain-containing protein [Phycicoccus sp.]
MPIVLLVVGAALAAVGLALVPLPGPGVLVLTVALPVLAVGGWLQMAERRSRRRAAPRHTASDG